LRKVSDTTLTSTTIKGLDPDRSSGTRE
jgi:hypothetical protein